MMTTKTAVTAAMTPVSTGDMVARMMNAPHNLHAADDDPLWHVVRRLADVEEVVHPTRLIMSPEFTRSKYVKQKRSYWSKRSWRIRDSMRAPMMWPCAETK